MKFSGLVPPLLLNIVSWGKGGYPKTEVKFCMVLFAPDIRGASKGENGNRLCWTQLFCADNSRVHAPLLIRNLWPHPDAEFRAFSLQKLKPWQKHVPSKLP